MFIKRTLSPRDPWSGNIAMPGGRADADDGDDDEATAIREVREEARESAAFRHFRGPCSRYETIALGAVHGVTACRLASTWRIAISGRGSADWRQIV